jgi:hypothetical protein
MAIFFTSQTRAAAVACIMLSIGCRESNLKSNNSSEDALHLGAKIKARNSASSSDRQSNSEQVWRRFGLHESREPNLSKNALIDRLGQLRDKRYSTAGAREFEIAIGQLAELDPSSALSYFALSEMRRGEPGFRLAASIIAEIEPELLKKWLQSELKAGLIDVRTDCLVTAMEALSGVDPQSALEYYLENDWKGANSPDALNMIFTQYGGVDPLGGLAIAESKLKGLQLDEACYRLALSSGRDNPSASMEIASKISEKTLRGLAIQGNLSRLFDSNPVEALEELKALKPSDLQEVLSSSTGIHLDGSILQKIAKEDPEALVQTVSSLVLSESTEQLFRSIVDELSRSNPDKSMEVIESLPEGAAKRNMESIHFGRIASDDFEGACEQASAISDPQSRASAYGGIGKTAGQKGLEEVMKFSSSLIESDRASFLSTSLPQVLNSNPKQVCEALMARRLSIPDSLQLKVYYDLGARLDGADSEYAQNWLDSLPASQKPQAFMGIAESSISRDIVEFSQKLNGMPRDPVWRVGVEALIKTLQSTDPESARPWQAQLNEFPFK